LTDSILQNKQQKTEDFKQQRTSIKYNHNISTSHTCKTQVQQLLLLQYTTTQHNHNHNCKVNKNKKKNRAKLTEKKNERNQTKPKQNKQTMADYAQNGGQKPYYGGGYQQQTDVNPYQQDSYQMGAVPQSSTIPVTVGGTTVSVPIPDKQSIGIPNSMLRCTPNLTLFFSCVVFVSCSASFASSAVTAAGQYQVPEAVTTAAKTTLHNSVAAVKEAILSVRQNTNKQQTKPTYVLMLMNLFVDGQHRENTKYRSPTGCTRVGRFTSSAGGDSP